GRSRRARMRDGPPRAARAGGPRVPAPARGAHPRPARHRAPAMLSSAASGAPVMAAEPAPSVPDAESAAWVAALRGGGPSHDAALERLHALLLRAARFELRRRGAQADFEDLALQ